MQANSDAIIDHTYYVETPEGIEMHAELAGVIPRGAAYLIDFIIRLGILLGFSLLLIWFGKTGWGVLLILWFIIEWLYPVAYEVLRGGQTPGKRKMDLIVYNDDLTPVTWATSILRNLMRSADLLPFGYFFGLLTMFVGNNSQRLGDLVAGTIVVHKPEQLEPITLPNIEATLPNFSLDQKDRRAIIRFVQQNNAMTQERANELATILSSVTGKTDVQNIHHIYGIGNWLLGATSATDNKS